MRIALITCGHGHTWFLLLRVEARLKGNSGKCLRSPHNSLKSISYKIARLGIQVNAIQECVVICYPMCDYVTLIHAIYMPVQVISFIQQVYTRNTTVERQGREGGRKEQRERGSRRKIM